MFGIDRIGTRAVSGQAGAWHLAVEGSWQRTSHRPGFALVVAYTATLRGPLSVGKKTSLLVVDGLSLSARQHDGMDLVSTKCPSLLGPRCQASDF